KKDDIISISVETPDPKESAVLANALMNTYISDRQARADNVNSTSVGTLEGNKKELDAKLTQTRGQIAQLPQSDPTLRLDPSGNNNPLIQRMMAASAALAQVNMQLIQLQNVYGANAKQVQQKQKEAELYDTEYRAAKTEALQASDKQLRI